MLQDNVAGHQALKDLPSQGTKLLQLARSTPFLTSTLIGHKSKDNVIANLQLSSVDPLTREDFHTTMNGLQPT